MASPYSRTRSRCFFGQVGLLRKNDWDFQRGGQSGLLVSNLFPHIAEQADRLTVIRSMVTGSAITLCNVL